jgi:hypothetical protein
MGVSKMQRYQEAESMAREQRMLEVAAILAAGYLRLRGREHADSEHVEAAQN